MDLTQGNIKEHVKEIALPACVGLFFNTMFNIIDSFFAGMISTQAIAAMTLTFPIFFIILACSKGISTGASAIISNALGAKQPVTMYIAQTMTYGVCSSFFIMALGLFSSSYLLKLLGAEGQLHFLSLSYINMLFLGTICFFLNASANAVLLSYGNSKTMRNILIIGCLINGILDPWFLYGGLGVPAMGLKGLAIATVFGMLFSCSYTLGRVIYEGHFKHCHLKDFIPSRQIFYAITEQSIPAAINMLSIAAGTFVVTYYVNKFGSDYVAAYGIAMRVQQIFLLPSVGINVAALMIIGQNNGAGSYNRIDETIRECLKYGTLLMTAGFLLMYFSPTFFLKIFISQPEVISIGVVYLKIAALSNWAYAILATYASVLQGLKRPHFLSLLGFVKQVALPIIVFYFIVDIFHLSVVSLWVSIFIMTWLAALLTFFFARHILSQEKAINRNFLDQDH